MDVLLTNTLVAYEKLTVFTTAPSVRDIIRDSDGSFFIITIQPNLAIALRNVGVINLLKNRSLKRERFFNFHP